MKKMIKYHILLIMPLVAAILSCSFENQTLVTIDGEKYTVADFRETHEFLTTEDSLQRVRKIDDFINQMLIIKEAQAKGYDQDQVVQIAYETHKKEIISRGYYEANVVNKIKVSNSQLRKAYAKIIDQYHIAQIVVADESLALFVEQELKKGIAFESLLHLSLDTITENGDIGVFSAMSLPPEMMDQFKKIEVGKTTNAINFGQYYYLIKILEHSKADSPTFEEIRNELEANLKREKTMEQGEKFIKKLIEDAEIEYNDEGLEALLKPDSLITEEDLNMWVIKKYDSSFVLVKSIRDAVMYQYRQSFIDPKILIERVLIPDLIYEKALRVHFDKNIEIERKLKNAVGLLAYQKFYSDEVLEKALVDSMEVVNYYNEHIDEFNEQKLNEAFSRISGQLRNTKIDRIRKDIYEQLRNKYEVVVKESAFEKLLEEAK